MSRPIVNNIFIEYAQQSNPTISDRDIVIFLAGPTPQYNGNDPATYSWRDGIAVDIDRCFNNIYTEDKIILVTPEPQSRKWEDTKYGMNDGQITWEHKWLERSNIIIFWHETRWKPNKETLKNCYHGKEIANIGIQFRFEVGLYISNVNKIRIFYLPKHAEGLAGVMWWLANKKDKNLFGFYKYDSIVLKTVDAIKFFINMN